MTIRVFNTLQKIAAAVQQPMKLGQGTGAQQPVQTGRAPAAKPQVAQPQPVQPNKPTPPKVQPVPSSTPGHPGWEPYKPSGIKEMDDWVVNRRNQQRENRYTTQDALDKAQGFNTPNVTQGDIKYLPNVGPNYYPSGVPQMPGPGSYDAQGNLIENDDFRNVDFSKLVKR